MTDRVAAYELIKEIFFLLDDGDRRVLSQFNLTTPRFFALAHLDKAPGLSPNKLSTLMLCDKSNIARIIRGMESESLVLRRPHERDGRSYRLYLTSRGKRVLEQALRAHTAYTEERFDDMEEQDARCLQRSLGKLKSQLEAKLNLQQFAMAPAPEGGDTQQ